MKNVLVVQTAFLGDLVLTIPLIEGIKKTLKDCHLAVLVIPGTKDILIGHPGVDELIVYDKKNKDKSIFGFIKLIRHIRSKNFDIAILPHRSFRSAFLIWLSSIPIRIGFDKSAGKMFLNKLICYNRNKHELERNLDLIIPLGKSVGDTEIHLPISYFENEYAEKTLKKYKFTDDDLIVGINPGSVWPTKRWLPERYAELINSLTGLNYKIIIFGSSDDIKIAHQIISGLLSNAKDKIANMAGKTSLKQLSALINRCAVFVSNDSASMHIATAHKVPVIAIFGPTTPQIGFYPYGKESVVIQKELSCRPCGLHGGYKCRKNTHECMRDITADEVFKAVLIKMDLIKKTIKGNL